MNIQPITNNSQARRARRERDRFLAAADYVRSHPAPADIGAELWKAQADACASIAAEIGWQIDAYRDGTVGAEQ